MSIYNFVEIKITKEKKIIAYQLILQLYMKITTMEQTKLKGILYNKKLQLPKEKRKQKTK